ncbi:MAG: hypothetical protein JSR17_04015 [Proteobacteria bacterium]|nr:hypothetical protein [Pseudomonadota bacterium]
MNLRSRFLIMGCFALILQILILFSFFYYYLNPQIVSLEKSLVEKNLHRGLEILQREIFHLTHVTQLLAQDPTIEQLIKTPALQLLPNELLQRKMIHQEINLIYVLNDDLKVIWESTIDLNSERPYPKLSFLTTLWNARPALLDHNSAVSLYAGIVNSKLGPLYIVSAPITVGSKNQVIGTLIVGRLITQDVMHLLQSLSYTDVKLWPIGSASLNADQTTIVQKLLQGDSDFMINESGNMYRGYMFLQDINQQPTLLISTTQPGNFSKIIDVSLSEMVVVFILVQSLIFIVFFWVIRSTLLLPARALIEQINRAPKDLRPLRVDAKPWNEMGMLANEIAHLIVRHQDKLAQETTMAYKEGCYQTRLNLFNEIEDTLKPIIENIEISEKKLSNLPTNDLEWIVAESKTGQYSPARFEEYTEKLQRINDKLRHYQKETRHRLYDLYAKTLRNVAALRAQARSLETIREFTPIRMNEKKEKSSMLR